MLSRSLLVVLFQQRHKSNNCLFLLLFLIFLLSSTNIINSTLYYHHHLQVEAFSIITTSPLSSHHKKNNYYHTSKKQYEQQQHQRYYYHHQKFNIIPIHSKLKVSQQQHHHQQHQSTADTNAATKNEDQQSIKKNNIIFNSNYNNNTSAVISSSSLCEAIDEPTTVHQSIGGQQQQQQKDAGVVVTTTSAGAVIIRNDHHHHLEEEEEKEKKKKKTHKVGVFDQFIYKTIDNVLMIYSNVTEQEIHMYDVNYEEIIQRTINAILLSTSFLYIIYTIFNIDASLTRGWTQNEIALRLPIDTWSSYENSLQDRPVYTKTLINIIIYLLGDWLSQTIFQSKHILDFNTARTLRNGFIGLCFGPLVHEYYKFSDYILPVEGGTWNRIQKIIMDQTIYLSVKCSIYIIATGLLQGDTWDTCITNVKNKIGNICVTAWKFWPLVHLITYNIIPARHRILWVNCVDLIWNAILATIAAQKTTINTTITETETTTTTTTTITTEPIGNGADSVLAVALSSSSSPPSNHTTTTTTTTK